ncbi:MAG: inosine/xanthosine triphosphatase [Methanobacteriota archaeon]|nr:MAG: inosine/xanthosine triphosphatase [Euryarchaeota archaeon]
MGRRMRVVLGGTFDILHAGHEALLGAAFEGRPEQVLIGLTTDRFARESRPRVNPYAVRERNLKGFLAARKLRRARIEPIDDPFGPADDRADLEVLVVSAERLPVGVALNQARIAKGLPPLHILAVPMVPAQDGLPIASRRIRAGVIDRSGRRLKPLQVFVGSDNPVKVASVRAVLRSLSVPARIRGLRVSSEVPDQPFDLDALRGAINRARAALGEGDLGIGIEAGLIWSPDLSDYFDVQYCAVLDRAGRMTVGHGPGFAYPPKVVERVKAGETVADAMARLTGIRDIGSKQGAIGFLTEGTMDRRRLTESAVLMAMVPRIRRDLYPAGSPSR